MLYTVFACSVYIVQHATIDSFFLTVQSDYQFHVNYVSFTTVSILWLASDVQSIQRIH